MLKLDHQSQCQKSKKRYRSTNVINLFGADAVRWFVLSDSPPERDIQWSDEGISGSYKFIQNLTVSEMIQNIDKNNNLSKDDISKIDKVINKLIKEVTFNIENFHFNVSSKIL